MNRNNENNFSDDNQSSSFSSFSFEKTSGSGINKDNIADNQKSPQPTEKDSGFARFDKTYNIQDIPARAAGFSSVDEYNDNNTRKEEAEEAAQSAFGIVPESSAYEPEQKFYDNAEINLTDAYDEEIVAADSQPRDDEEYIMASSKKKSKKKSKNAGKIIGIVFAFLCMGAACLAVWKVTNTVRAPFRIDNNITDLNELNVGVFYKNIFDNYMGDKSIVLKTDSSTQTVKLSDYGFTYAPGGKVSETYVSVLSEESDKIVIEKHASNGNIAYNETKIRNLISEISSKYGNPMAMPSYTIEDDSLAIKAGSDGMGLDFDTLVKNLCNAIKLRDYSDIHMDIEILEAPGVDIDKIYKEVYCLPEDASYSVDENGQVTYFDEVIGLDFDLETARQIVGQDSSSWIVPLKITEPSVTVKKLKAPTCPDLLSTNTTKYSAGNVGRSKNLALSGEKINGLVLQPGEVFSFNQTVGKRTVEAGFRKATVYTGEGLDEGIGGGICQTSSTVYYAAVKANLEIVERKNHMYTVSYWNLKGADATISWGGPDLKIKNNRDYPIKFVIECGGGQITCRIYGTDVDGITARLENVIISTKPYETIHKPADSTKKNTGGSNGMTVDTYRVLYQGDKEISRTFEARSVYRPLNAVIYDGGTSETTTTTTTTVVTSTTTSTTTAAVASEEE